jgi:hypothetical protein
MGTFHFLYFLYFLTLTTSLKERGTKLRIISWKSAGTFHYKLAEKGHKFVFYLEKI